MAREKISFKFVRARREVGNKRCMAREVIDRESDRQLLRFAMPRPEVGAESNLEACESFDVAPDVAFEDPCDSVVVDASGRFDGSQRECVGSGCEIGGDLLRDDCGEGAIEFRRGPVPGRDVVPWWPSGWSSHTGTVERSGLDSASAGSDEHQVGLSKEIDSVLCRIMEYRPQLPPAQWERIEPFVREAVLAAGPRTDSRAKDLLAVTSRICAWCDGEGLPLTNETVFHADVIEEFVLNGMSSCSAGSRANRRSMLYRIAEAVLGWAATPSRQTPLHSSNPVKPYTSQEMIAFENWGLGRPTFWQRHNVLVLLALGAGAGLSTEDLVTVTGSHIAADSEGVLVSCDGRRSRTVPALARWERTLVSAADAVGGDTWLFRPQRTTSSKNCVSNFVGKNPAVDLPNLTMQRLRATWIVHHLASRTPLGALVPASGADTLHSLARYLVFVPGMGTAEQRRYLRGEL